MFRIYRRMFNPPEGEKNLKRLVAQFQPIAEAEAYLLVTTLQGLATDLRKESQYSSFRYTIERDVPAPRAASEAIGVQVDISKATSTKRPIAFKFSWHQDSEAECTCLAYHLRYGSIRGTVENSPQGRKLFINRITAVWPNASIEK